jgi:two-component sensor histidine kinase
VKNPEIIELLDQTAHRIQSMSLIYEAIYRSNTFDDVHFRNYVKSLIKYTKTVSRISNIVIKDDICDCVLPIADATNLGMIIMELITNSLKYAFPDDRDGEICIQMEVVKGIITLIVSDNGIGIASDFDFKKTSTLGMQIVVSLVEQLEGSIKLLLVTEGTSFSIVV